MEQYHDSPYLELVRYVLKHGVYKPNRTGIGTYSVFGYQMRFNLHDGTIPLLTTKKMHTRSIIHEILWYLQGADNIKYLNDNNVTIWDEWADETGNLGPVYGYQWRKWPTYKTEKVVSHDCWGNSESWIHTEQSEPIDQIVQVVDKLKNNPNDRRMIVSAWNVADLDKMALPPCHYVFQFYTRPLSQDERIHYYMSRFNQDDLWDELNHSKISLGELLDNIGMPKYELSMLLNQRSCDVGLGVPFNIVQYSILLRMFCEVVNMIPGEFIWNGGDVHVYENHIEQLEEQLLRQPYPSPLLKFTRKINDIDNFTFDDFVIEHYTSHPSIKMDVAV